jgi:peptide/nickel transport system substrate-binding protein
MTDKLGWIDRRRLVQLLGAGVARLPPGCRPGVRAGAQEHARARHRHQRHHHARSGAACPIHLADDGVGGLRLARHHEAGEYINVAPSLATKWARTPDGKGWRFTLRDGVKFSTGNVMTVEDVKWSFDRVINLGDQPSQYIGHVDRVEIVDKSTIDIILKLPAEPLLSIIAAPEFVVLERKVAEANGGTADKDAKTKDKLDAWINGNSCGTGAYRIAAWERNQQIQLVRNEHYWAGKPPFERIVIRHISDGAAQLLAVRRGDIDAAFNLIPEQIAALKSEPNVRLAPLASLDFVYMALTQEPSSTRRSP